MFCIERAWVDFESPLKDAYRLHVVARHPWPVSQCVAPHH
jgi:hypothetical protein